MPQQSCFCCIPFLTYCLLYCRLLVYRLYTNGDIVLPEVNLKLVVQVIAQVIMVCYIRSQVYTLIFLAFVGNQPFLHGGSFLTVSVVLHTLSNVVHAKRNFTRLCFIIINSLTNHCLSFSVRAHCSSSNPHIKTTCFIECFHAKPELIQHLLLLNSNKKLLLLY